MMKDQYGYEVSGGSAEAVMLYDQAIGAFNLYRGDPVGLLDQAASAAPGFAMAHIARAHMFATTSEPGALVQARSLVDTALDLRLTERERSHVEALQQLFAGEWSGAALLLDRHNARYPHDLLALQVGHLIDFFRGNARNLRDRIARVLPAWSEDIPGYSILLGMYAFGLEECGEYRRAEDTGRRAVGLQPFDCWAHHAVSHVMEMQGRAEDGIGWMIAREPYWSGDDNAFKVHNWWHRALFHLHLGQYDAALALYDGPVREGRSALALDLVDAASLLWRLSLSGVDVGNRWLEVADAWEQHADGMTYAFNDWHAVMAWLGAGRSRNVDELISLLRRSAAAESESSRWIRDVGLPLIEGFRAFWHDDYQATLDSLLRVRHIANAFGGSHAQRDVIDWTLAEAAIRAGDDELATALVNERLAQKPHSSINMEFLSRTRRSTAGQPPVALLRGAPR